MKNSRAKRGAAFLSRGNVWKIEAMGTLVSYRGAAELRCRLDGGDVARLTHDAHDAKIVCTCPSIKALPVPVELLLFSSPVSLCHLA